MICDLCILSALNLCSQIAVDLVLRLTLAPFRNIAKWK